MGAWLGLFLNDDWFALWDVGCHQRPSRNECRDYIWISLKKRLFSQPPSQPEELESPHHEQTASENTALGFFPSTDRPFGSCSVKKNRQFSHARYVPATFLHTFAFTRYVDILRVRSLS